MRYLLCAALFDAHYRCCDIHSQNLVDSAKPLLRKAIQISQQTPYWHCRLLFQLAVCIISHIFFLFTSKFVKKDKQDIQLFPFLSPNHCSCSFGILFFWETTLLWPKIKWASGIDCYGTFLFQQLHTLEKDLVSACDLLGVGAEYARVVGSEYTR